MLRFHFFTAKQCTWVHEYDRGPLPSSLNSIAYFDVRNLKAVEGLFMFFSVSNFIFYFSIWLEEVHQQRRKYDTIVNIRG